MKDDGVVAQPLSDAEIEQVDEFLTSESTPEGAMDISMMDGFMSALASGPMMMMPSSMLRWIWDADRGEQSPTFASAAESKHIVELIIRYWNNVNDTLNNTLDGYQPLLLQREVDGAPIPVIDEWCVGYYTCIAIDRAAWAPLMVQHPEWFAVIMLYGTEDGWGELKRRQDSLEQHQALADSLAGSVRNIHRYWSQQRRVQIARGEVPGVIAGREPIGYGLKTGRNDLCPCGSGRKYKRCHGAVENVQHAGNESNYRDRTAVEHATIEPGRYPVHSQLSQRVVRGETAVEIEIYEDGKGGWLLEVVDEFGNSTVWDDSFPTDSAALAEALNVIDTEGIVSLVGSIPDRTTRH